jgi:hypothetical protein
MSALRGIQGFDRQLDTLKALRTPRSSPELLPAAVQLRQTARASLA